MGGIVEAIFEIAGELLSTAAIGSNDNNKGCFIVVAIVLIAIAGFITYFMI